MPLDGLMLHGLVNEFHSIIVGGIVDKIAQPSKDEIILTVRNNNKNQRLLLSANATASRVNIISLSKANPQNPPVFCMVLRKHLNRAKITKIEQTGLERIVKIHFESNDELGDLAYKILIIEIMGKHSNIILVNGKTGLIIDSLKHVDFEISRVREVMPGRYYELPPKKGAIEIDSYDFNDFNALIDNCEEGITAIDFLIKNFDGMSKFVADKICLLSGVEASANIIDISDEGKIALKEGLNTLKSSVKEFSFKGYIINENNKYTDFSFEFFDLGKLKSSYLEFDSINETIDSYYLTKEKAGNILNKKNYLIKELKYHSDKLQKKLNIQIKTIADSKDYDLNRIYGDLINSNSYSIEENAESFTALNYYDPESKEITITLDKNLTPSENSQKYFKKYNKQKKSYSFATECKETTMEELFYIENHILSINMAIDIEGLEEIEAQLIDEGYIHKKAVAKKNGNKNNQKSSKSKTNISLPYHYISSNGFDIYVGKNNMQNDILTLKTAQKNDLWLHIKNAPGSHVIVRSGENDVDEKTLHEAATLAAFYSKSRQSSKVSIDYTQRKNVKKPSGAKPGMVIYENYKTIIVEPSEDLINSLHSS